MEYVNSDVEVEQWYTSTRSHDVHYHVVKCSTLNEALNLVVNSTFTSHIPHLHIHRAHHEVGISVHGSYVCATLHYI